MYIFIFYKKINFEPGTGTGSGSKIFGTGPDWTGSGSRTGYPVLLLTPSEDFVFNMNELRKKIVLYIVEGAHSFAIVKEKGLRRMMSKANPDFVPFSRSTTKRELLSMYVGDRDKIKDMMLKAPGRICLTTDN